MSSGLQNNEGWGMIDEGGWRKGPWTAEEDALLLDYVKLHGEGKWNNVARLAAGLKRNGKSCRLRWVNYLRPDLKRGQITPHEETVILELHARWGNRWSTIARSLPGRTDNEIKNYWRTHFKKKAVKSSSEKSRARLLRRQQFQQQQQQYQDRIDMKKIVSNLYEEDEKKLPSFAQLRQEMACPSVHDEQWFVYSLINGYGTVPEASNDVLWDGLWNLDDLHGNVTNRASYQHALASFS